MEYITTATFGAIVDTKSKTDIEVLEALVEFLHYGQHDGPVHMEGSYIPSTLNYQLGGSDYNTPETKKTVREFSNRLYDIKAGNEVTFGTTYEDEVTYLLSDVQSYLRTIRPVGSRFGMLGTTIGFWSIR